MNQQRTVIYSRRKQALIGENLKDEILEMIDQYAEDIANQHWEAGDMDALREEVRRNLVVGAGHSGHCRMHSHGA